GPGGGRAAGGARHVRVSLRGLPHRARHRGAGAGGPRSHPRGEPAHTGGGHPGQHARQHVPLDRRPAEGEARHPDARGGAHPRRAARRGRLPPAPPL
ncbi:MAG: Cytochrome C oxidase, cbb3-type, subunit III, partial [uncultured Gemmatimonadetes bacterium]